MMATPKTICCRLCNDTGVKLGTNSILDAFEQLFGSRDAPKRDDDCYYSCPAGAYRRHQSKSKVPT